MHSPRAVAARVAASVRADLARLATACVSPRVLEDRPASAAAASDKEAQQAAASEVPKPSGKHAPEATPMSPKGAAPWLVRAPLGLRIRTKLGSSGGSSTVTSPGAVPAMVAAGEVQGAGGSCAEQKEEKKGLKPEAGIKFLSPSPSIPAAPSSPKGGGLTRRVSFLAAQAAAKFGNDEEELHEVGSSGRLYPVSPHPSKFFKRAWSEEDEEEGGSERSSRNGSRLSTVQDESDDEGVSEEGGLSPAGSSQLPPPEHAHSAPPQSHAIEAESSKESFADALAAVLAKHAAAEDARGGKDDESEISLSEDPPMPLGAGAVRDVSI